MTAPFRFLLTLWEHAPARPLMETLRLGVENVVAWAQESDPNERISLNLLWTDGERMVGSRLNRTLWYVEREGVSQCEICGSTHVHHDAKRHYAAVEIASEPITDEPWHQVPNGSAFSIGPDFRLNITPLGARATAAIEGEQLKRPETQGALSNASRCSPRR